MPFIFLFTFSLYLKMNFPVEIVSRQDPSTVVNFIEREENDNTLKNSEQIHGIRKLVKRLLNTNLFDCDAKADNTLISGYIESYKLYKKNSNNVAISINICLSGPGKQFRSIAKHSKTFNQYHLLMEALVIYVSKQHKETICDIFKTAMSLTNTKMVFDVEQCDEELYFAMEQTQNHFCAEIKVLTKDFTPVIEEPITNVKKKRKTTALV